MLDVSKFTRIPFLDRGRDFSGCDCWGLVMLIYKHLFNIELRDYDISARNSRGIAAAMYKDAYLWPEIKIPETPCLAIYKSDMAHPNIVTHAGVYVEGKIIHTMLDCHSVMVPVNHWTLVGFEGFHRWTPIVR